jgi:hypothetical protein
VQVNPEQELFGEIKPTDEIIDDYGLEGQPDDELLVTGNADQLEALQEKLRKLEFRQVFARGPLKP